MSENFNQYLGIVAQWIGDHLGKAITTTALFTGGITLFFYALSIDYLPDFSLSDITGTLISTFSTTALIVLPIALYCVIAGVAARYVLEQFYPNPDHRTPGSVEGKTPAKASYEKLIRGPFIVGVTYCALWIWSTIYLATIPILPPHHTQLAFALWIMGGTLLALILVDWQLFPQQWVRNVRSLLLIANASAAIVLAVLIVVISQDTPNLAGTSEPEVYPQVSSSNWQSQIPNALRTTYLIGSVTVVLGVIAMVIASTRRAMRTACKPETSSDPFRNEATRLVAAKLAVISVFALFAIFVLMFAGVLTRIGSARDQTLNLFVLSIILTVLNWASFSTRVWKERVVLGLVMSALVMFVIPGALKNPYFFPRTFVSMLGLGNLHLQSVGLTSKQCATLAPYGLRCEKDNERPITLVNANLLSRLGSTIVLEVVILQTPPAALEGNSAPSQSALATRDLSDEELHRPRPLVMPSTSTVSPRLSSQRYSDACDAALLMQMETPASEELKCVKLFVPKDQVLGYSVAGRRTYGHGYTAYLY